MGPKTRELFDGVSEMAALLEQDGDAHWHSYMLRVLLLLKDSDYHGIEFFLGAFGGMGSLNDVCLGQSFQNGVFAWKPGAKELNERFEQLRGRAWDLALWIKHHHDISNS